MKYYTVDGPGWKKAKEIFDTLKSKSIQANITIGGVDIYPESDEELKIAQELCNSLNVTLHEGGPTTLLSRMMERTERRRNG